MKKSTRSSKSTKSTSKRVLVFEQSATAVVRAMGKKDYDFDQTKKVMTHLKAGLGDSTLRIQLSAGRLGERGLPAKLTADQWSQVEKLAGAKASEEKSAAKK
jgi:hypothetical protein